MTEGFIYGSLVTPTVVPQLFLVVRGSGWVRNHASGQATV